VNFFVIEIKIIQWCIHTFCLFLNQISNLYDQDITKQYYQHIDKHMHDFLYNIYSSKYHTKYMSYLILLTMKLMMNLFQSYHWLVCLRMMNLELMHHRHTNHDFDYFQTLVSMSKHVLLLLKIFKNKKKSYNYQQSIAYTWQ